MKQLLADVPECVWDSGRLLGEGAWWSAADQALYWLDIKRPVVMRYRPKEGTRELWSSPELIGCFAPRASGGFVGAFRSTICSFELGESGFPIELRPIASPDGHGACDRFNDGKCHPDGSFWTGSMDDREEATTGYFYRLDPSHRLERLSGPHRVCNGPAFSPDGRTAYLTDSATQTIHRLDIASRQSEVFARFEQGDGYPDGMTTDSEGRLWIAFWDGWKVRCLSPSGERLVEIELPVARPTSCAFGGRDLSTLFITTARIGLNSEQRDRQPLAGGLFACKIDGAAGWDTPQYLG